MAQKRSIRNSVIYRYLNTLPVEVCLYLMAKTGRQSTKKAFSHYFTQLQNAKIHVKGNDLKKLGIPPGKIYKEIMEKLLDDVLDGKVRSRDEELRFVKAKYVNN